MSGLERHAKGWGVSRGVSGASRFSEHVVWTQLVVLGEYRFIVSAQIPPLLLYCKYSNVLPSSAQQESEEEKAGKSNACWPFRRQPCLAHLSAPATGPLVPLPPSLPLSGSLPPCQGEPRGNESERKCRSCFLGSIARKEARRGPACRSLGV